jgi:ABC-2 type transport system permease protein
MMKKYLAFTAKAFQRTLTYRFELWMELFINVLFMLIYVYLWKALYTGQTSVEGYDLNGILTYIVVSQTLLTFTFTLRVARIIEEKVRTGEVVTDLMKPVDFQLMTLATAAGTSSHTVLFNMLPKFLLFHGILRLSLPPSLLTVSLFIISVVLGYIILFSMEFIIGIFAFWLVEIRGIYALVIWGLSMLFSGYFLPLEFYPPFLAKVAAVLPFRAIIYFPTAIYTGQLTGSALVTALLIQLTWVAVLMGLGRLAYRAAFHKLVIQGG